MRWERQALIDYLARAAGAPVELGAISTLGGVSGAAAIKAFGYGKPLRIEYRRADDPDEPRSVVLRQVPRNGFGRERDADRVADVWLDFTTFNTLPRHVPARDMLALTADGQIESLGHVADVLLLTEYAPGQPYADDLLRIRDTGVATDADHSRAVALARYLAEIHRVAHDDALLWRRRLRDLIGHGEGVMGLTDSYPTRFPVASQERLQAIEMAANRWRWKLKPLSNRLRQVHGDFHPFNVLFGEGDSFVVIDRSRGAWGEPADDVSCMAINYLFFSLQRDTMLSGAFAELYDTFWRTYLEQTGDEALLFVIQPWFAWRALVLASPQWYPSMPDALRQRLLCFAERVLAEEFFSWNEINRYLEPA